MCFVLTDYTDFVLQNYVLGILKVQVLPQAISDFYSLHFVYYLRHYFFFFFLSEEASAT